MTWYYILFVTWLVCLHESMSGDKAGAVIHHKHMKVMKKNNRIFFVTYVLFVASVIFKQ
jgi:hypothetical protein